MKREAAKQKEDKDGEVFIESGRKLKYLLEVVGESGTDFNESIYGEE